jgi:hypothetical protein
VSALEINLKIAGVLLLALALAHFYIAERFRWREESRRLSPLNGQAMLVHSFFIALMVGFMGALTLFWSQALIMPSALGLPVAGGLTIFWFIRLYCQWFVYDRELWRGKRFESVFHLLFSAFWLYLTVLFGMCLRLQLGL